MFSSIANLTAAMMAAAVTAKHTEREAEDLHWYEAVTDNFDALT